MMVVGICREGEIGQGGTEVEHGGELDAELTRRMHRRTESEGFEHPARLVSCSTSAGKFPHRFSALIVRNRTASVLH
jgi:hypothetical protein